MKSRYETWLSDEGLKKLSELKKADADDEKIAQEIGISVKRLLQWKEKFSSVKSALSDDKSDEQVRLAEEALVKSAVGYRYMEVTYQKNSETGEMEPVKSVEKENAPNTTALFFLLRNMRPDKWSDKPEQRDTSEHGVVILPEIVSPDEAV